MIFSLIPFPVQDLPDITIQGKVCRKKNRFSVHYNVAGNIGEIFLPSPIANSTRKDNLWHTTCFEFFIATKESAGYWEFNLSPSGEWNAYIMDAYRQVNMREERGIQRLHFKVQRDTEYFSLMTELDLSPIIPKELPIEAGITCVIQASSGRNSYWAPIHPHTEADFHLRESFVFEFPYTA